MSIRDQWIKLSPGVTTKKTNKTITIPAFSAACGPTLYSLAFAGSTSAFDPSCKTVNTNLLNFVNNFTTEFWVKPLIRFDVQGIRFTAKNSDATYTYSIGISQSGVSGDTGQYLTATIITTTTSYRIQAGLWAFNHDWHHVAVTFSSADNVFILYLDGVEAGRVTTAGTAIVGATNSVTIGGVGTLTAMFGNIAELRMWNTTRTADQIKQTAAIRRSLGLTGIDTGLVGYWKFNEGSGATATDAINGIVCNLNTTETSWSSTNTPPLVYGASFIAERVTCTSDGPSSLVFPVVAPEDANHCLCVSWLDGEDTIRRKLYSADSDIGIEDIAPNPPDYKGEVLPETFYLEYWSVDGMPTVDLDSDFTIQTSHTRNPEHGYDHSIAADFTPVASSALAVAFPATFPLTFSAQQTYP